MTDVYDIRQELQGISAMLRTFDARITALEGDKTAEKPAAEANVVQPEPAASDPAPAPAPAVEPAIIPKPTAPAAS